MSRKSKGDNLEPNGPASFIAELVIKRFAPGLPKNLKKYVGQFASGVDQALAEANAVDDTGLDPYEILGISPEATWGEIQGRHRDLVKLLHPDVGGDKRLFELISEAYKELEQREKDKNPQEN